MKRALRGAALVAALWVSLQGIGLRRGLAQPLDRVSARLAPGARVVQRTEDELHVEAEGLSRILVVGSSPKPEVDIWYATVRRRRRNPYRVWFIDRALLKSESLPRTRWARYLSVDFLRVLRLGDKPSP